MASCGNCSVNNARKDDYLCSGCRRSLLDLKNRSGIASIIDMAVQLNKPPTRVLVSENESWVFLDLIREDETQFTWVAQIQYLRRFVIWKATARLFEFELGQPVGEDEIPQDEWAFALRMDSEDDLR